MSDFSTPKKKFKTIEYDTREKMRRNIERALKPGISHKQGKTEKIGFFVVTVISDYLATHLHSFVDPSKDFTIKIGVKEKGLTPFKGTFRDYHAKFYYKVKSGEHKEKCKAFISCGCEDGRLFISDKDLREFCIEINECNERCGIKKSYASIAAKTTEEPTTEISDETAKEILDAITKADVNEDGVKYFDIHMQVKNGSKEGYSVFVTAHDENEAVELMTMDHLYEEPEDLNNIDYVGEISKEEYLAAVGIKEKAESSGLENEDNEELDEI